MKLSHVVLAATVLLGSSLVFAQSNDPKQEISQSIGKLRSLADDVRAKETMRLALAIRKLPSGPEKVGLAGALCNLATEGYFGENTLQEVANTLTSAVKEYPPKSQNGKPSYSYTQLAQLARYEDIEVDLKAPEFKQENDRLAALDKIRSDADFTLKDLDGKAWTRSSLKGKVVLVNFWATWCPPCRKEMPDLQALSHEFKDKGLVVLAISDEEEKVVRPFIEQNKYDYPILLDPGRKVNEMYQVDGIPKNFVYGRDGKLAAQAIDMRTRAQFLKLLAKAGLK